MRQEGTHFIALFCVAYIQELLSNTVEGGEGILSVTFKCRYRCRVVVSNYIDRYQVSNGSV